MAAKFRYGDRWLALTSVPVSAAERAALEGRDRQIEDYVSALAEAGGGGGGGGGTMLSYTPTLTGVTEGDGTKAGAYMSDGDATYIRVRFTLGATSAITGPVGVSFPAGVSVHADSQLMAWFHDDDTADELAGRGMVLSSTSTSELLLQDGTGLLLQDGTGLLLQDSGAASGGGSAELRVHNTAGTYAVLEPLSATVPFTWVSGDWFSVSGWIEPI